MQLTDTHLWIIGMVAMVIVWGINRWQKAAGHQIHRGWLTGGVYVAALLISLAFQLPTIPVMDAAAYSDPVALIAAVFKWINDLLITLGPFVALATLVYNALLSKVMDGLADRFAAKG